MLVDGVVTDDEVRALDQFLERNPDLKGAFPGDVLYRRIRPMIVARSIDPQELHELRALLEDTIGERSGVHDIGAQASSTLPLTDPPPKPLKFEGVCYVVTGAFIYGARKAVTQAIAVRGGICEDGVTRRTDVLLVGSLASRDWKHSSFGRKIQKAIEIQREGKRLVIVAEDHWVSQLGI